MAGKAERLCRKDTVSADGAPLPGSSVLTVHVKQPRRNPGVVFIDPWSWLSESNNRQVEYYASWTTMR